VDRVIGEGKVSTTALQGSTEAEQFYEAKTIVGIA
jgi:hypothetical protein